MNKETQRRLGVKAPSSLRKRPMAVWMQKASSARERPGGGFSMVCFFPLSFAKKGNKRL